MGVRQSKAINGALLKKLVIARVLALNEPVFLDWKFADIWRAGHNRWCNAAALEQTTLLQCLQAGICQGRMSYSV